MNLLVRLVSIVVYVFILFQEDTAVHIDVANFSINSEVQVKYDNFQPIEPDYVTEETLKSEESDLSQIKDNEDINSNQLPETSDEETEKVKNRVVRQANGNLYPQLGQYYYGNNQYYNPPAQGNYSNNPQWDRKTNAVNSKSSNGYNDSFSQNPLANITFNGHSPTAYSQNNYYNSTGSSYNTQRSPYNSQWDRNYNHNNSYSSNPVANTTFNGYPSSSYPSSQNGYYDNPGSYNTPKPSQNSHSSQNGYYNNPGSYNTPRPSQNSQWDTNRYNNSSNSYNQLANTTINRYPYSSPQQQYNGSRPNQSSFGSTTPRYPYSTYPYKNPGQFGNQSSVYTTLPPYSASVRPGYPSDWRNYSRPNQGNIYVNNSTYRYNANNTSSGYPNPYQYTTPKYPYGQYPSNNNFPRNNSTYNGGSGREQSYGDYNPSYPFSPQFNSSVTKPSHYGQNNSYGNNPRPYNAGNSFNNSYPYGYSNNAYPGTQYGNNNYGAYSSTPPYNNGNLRPSYGGYPSSNNNGQSQNNWNSAQPYNSNGPHESLFNYPTKHNSTQYDPRKNPSYQFSY